jgi:hypothetical protein
VRQAAASAAMQRHFLVPPLETSENQSMTPHLLPFSSLAKGRVADYWEEEVCRFFCRCLVNFGERESERERKR